jgi:RNA 2',3'-cyclic 3'-phosphodiesterase
MDMHDLRTFIAVKIEPRHSLVQLMHQLKKAFSEESIKWVAENNFHLTLKFLGSTSPQQVNEIKAVLQNIGRFFPAFHFDLKGIGYFKRKGQPRVLFIKIEKDALLKQLAAEIDTQVSLLGFEKENRPFNPHLTLGRIKFLKNKSRFYSITEKYSSKHILQTTIHEIILYQSILKPEGAHYEPLEIIQMDKQIPKTPLSGYNAPLPRK